MSDLDNLKRKAAEKAVEFIKSGMILGLGTGSTFNFVLELLSEKLKNGELKNIIGIPTSSKTFDLAQKLGVPCGTLDDYPVMDLTIDGADEVDNQLNVIKGGGGALLHEKIIAQASKQYIIIVDKSKISRYLGEKWPVPIEIIKIAAVSVSDFLKSKGAAVQLRKINDSQNFISDEGNYILDVNFGIIKKPKKLSKKISNRAGIVEHGLFVDLADIVIVASEENVEIMKKFRNKF